MMPVDPCFSLSSKGCSFPKGLAAALCLGALLWGTRTAAQQAPQYTLFSLNPYAYNVAFAGHEGTLVATGVYRKQWSGLEGAPETQHVNVHLPVSMFSSGVGLRIDNDLIGAHRVTQASLGYNYQWSIGQQGQFAIGVGAGYLQYSLDGNRLRAPEGVYPTTGVSFSHNDPRLPEGTVRAGTFIAEAGLRFTYAAWEAGMSVQPVFAPLLSTTSNDGKNAFQVKVTRHYIGYLGKEFTLGEWISLRPAVLVKSDLVRTQMEANLVAKWRDYFFIGGGYRGFTNTAQESAAFLAGIRINEKTRLAYSFDFPLGPLSGVQQGSHELLLRYSMGRPVGSGKLPPVVYNPRFF